jgi:SNF2 family DNA or RNA helicase
LSEHLRELKAKHRSLVLGMTGTLMQNDHKELWNLIDLVETDYLGSWEEFNGDTAHAIKHGRQDFSWNVDTYTIMFSPFVFCSLH